MYREGVKEAATKKIQAENEASSARIRDYLMCGKKTVPDESSYDANFVDKQEHTIVLGTETDETISERTLVLPSQTPLSASNILSDRSNILRGEKRPFIGGNNSYSKKHKHQNGGGRGVVVRTVQDAQTLLHTSFVNTTRNIDIQSSIHTTEQELCAAWSKSEGLGGGGISESDPI